MPNNRLTLNGAQLAEALLLLDGDMDATLTLVEREAFTGDKGEDMPAGIYALDNNYPDEGLYGPLNELNPLCP